MRQLLWPIFAVMLMLAWMPLLNAQPRPNEPPEEMLDRVTNEMITSLRANDQSLKQDPQMIYDIINRILVPYVDWNTMAKWVLGRSAWSQASDAQRREFSKEFKNLIIRTYASTLRAYNNQAIEYLPIRGGYEGKNRIQIDSMIRENGKEPIKVTYRLIQSGDTWKVYDIIIEGVSLLKGFQSQFSSEIQQDGLPSLIDRMRQHNEKPLR